MAEAKSEKEVWPEWRSIVEHYNKTTLTYGRDIFPAISGVVRNMKRHRSDRYFAGVWEDSVLEDLAWVACDTEKARPSEWNAPTWSWASVGGPVTFPNRRTFLSSRYTQEIEPLEQRRWFAGARITPVGQDETAQLSAAHMVLIGPMIFAKLDGHADILSQRQIYMATNKANKLAFAADYDVEKEGPKFVPMKTTIYILDLCQEPKLKNGERVDMSRKTFALVLKRIHEVDASDSQMAHFSSKPKDGTCERIGIMIEGPDQENPEGYVVAHGSGLCS